MQRPRRRALLIGAAIWSLCLLSFAREPRAAAPADGFQVDVPTLGLRFTTPADWVLAKESTRFELVLYGDAKKQTPLMRVRSFTGRLSAEDRLSSMKRELAGEEAQVKFVSSETWNQSGRLYQTVRAVYTSGTKEWHALFTVVDQPKKLQHAFWAFGKKKDLDRHWVALQASIASAKSIPTSGARPTEPEEPEAKKEAPQQKGGGKSVLSDTSSGLLLASWPAGFALDPTTEKAMQESGVILEPLDERAHRSTQFQLTARANQAENAARTESELLQDELKDLSAVTGLRSVPLRVGGKSAFMLRWTETSSDGGYFLNETYFVQNGATLFRIEFVAQESWAKARSRRTLVKDFIAGLSFR